MGIVGGGRPGWPGAVGARQARPGAVDRLGRGDAGHRECADGRAGAERPAPGHPVGWLLLAFELSVVAAGVDPSLVVAGATLAVAAVIQPARRRIQQAVDRRFNRRRHDAAQRIAAFNTPLHLAGCGRTMPLPCEASAATSHAFVLPGSARFSSGLSLRCFDA